MGEYKNYSNKELEQLKTEYNEVYPIFKSFTEKLNLLVKDILLNNDIEVAQIEYRTKSVDSFLEKINRDDKSYQDPLVEITDISGIRIIAYYLEDVTKICEIIRNDFKLDKENCVDKSKMLEVDEFNYASVHYVVSLSDSRKDLPEWKNYADLKAEIQIRTILQHSWAGISHKIAYKSEKDAPRELRRRLFRLSALLELADEEYSSLRSNIQRIEKEYSSEIGKDNLDIEIDLSSLESYLALTDECEKWSNIAMNAGFSQFISKDTPENFNENFLKILQLMNIKSLKELNDILKDASNWGESVLKSFYNMLEDFPEIPAVPQYILSILVFYSQKDNINDASLDKINFFGIPVKNSILKLKKLKIKK